MTLVQIKKLLFKLGLGAAACLLINYVFGPFFSFSSLHPADALAPLMNLFTSAGGARVVSALAAGQYNIIFILVDQERYLGPTFPTGTNFSAREQLKSIGTTFEKHYVCSNMSTSSRSVIYTGKHITDTKMFDNTDMPYMYSMNPAITTIGDMMREAGYYTAFKGKLHLAGGGALDGTSKTIFNTEDGSKFTVSPTGTLPATRPGA